MYCQDGGAWSCCHSWRRLEQRWTTGSLLLQKHMYSVSPPPSPHFPHPQHKERHNHSKSLIWAFVIHPRNRDKLPQTDEDHSFLYPLGANIYQKHFPQPTTCRRLGLNTLKTFSGTALRLSPCASRATAQGTNTGNAACGAPAHSKRRQERAHLFPGSGLMS